MKFQSLFDLYLNEIRDLYDAEHQIAKNLPKMIESASAEDLRKALTEHLDQTQLHINRLEEIFEMHSENPKSETCQGIKGILEEGRNLAKHDAVNVVRDAAIISAAQRVEHYEIAAYGCIRTYADQLGFDRAARILQQTLEEEEQMDRTLSSIARSTINVEAAKAAR